MSRSVGDLLRVSSGMAGAQLISLAAIPIITRLYSPEDYGYLGAYTNIIGFLLIVATGRYHLALVVSQDDEERRGLVWLSLCFIAASTCLSLLLVVGLGETIERWVGLPGLAAILWFWPVSNFAGGLFLLLQYWCTANRLFVPLGTSYATEALLGASTVILAGVILGSSAMWPIAARVVAVCGTTVLLALLIARAAWRKPSVRRVRVSWQKLRALLSKYRRFPLLTSPAAILNTLGLAGPPLILVAFFDSAVLAYFLIAERLLAIPLTVIGTSFGHVIYRDASEQLSEGSIATVLQDALRRLLRVGFFALGLIVVAGPTLFELVLGQSWRQAGLFAQILAFGALFRLLAAPFTNVTGSLGRQDIELRFNVLLAAGRNGAVLVGATLFGLIGAISLLSVTSALVYLYLLWRLFKAAETPLLPALSNMRLELLYQVILLGAVFFIEHYIGGHHTVLAAFIGVLAWLLLIYRHDREFVQALRTRGMQNG